MGIIHFAPLGASPGAVTSALSYLKTHPEWKGKYPGEMVQDVIIFCSYDIDEGARPADDYIWNSYGRPAARQGWTSSSPTSDRRRAPRTFPTPTSS